jgi:hypothetical protein
LPLRRPQASKRGDWRDWREAKVERRFRGSDYAKVPRAKKRKKVLPKRLKGRDVVKFTSHCIEWRACWCHYHTLFEASVLRRELLETIAPAFFYDVNIILIEHLILQICKLTDDEGTAKRRKLTIDFLANNVDFSKTSDDLKRLKQLTRQMERFRKRLLPARNKAIGHLDLRAAHRRKPLGEAPIAEWQQFWLDLQEFVALLHKRYVDSKVAFYLNGVGGTSDADQLAQAMRESAYFRAAIADQRVSQIVGDIALRRNSI